MAIKINTLEMLLEELDQDLQWRKKEIFNTMQEADSWLEEMAGIGKEE